MIFVYLCGVINQLKRFEMKKLFLLSAILIAVIVSSCSSGDYKSYVPADSKVVAKLDLATFFSQTGVDQEKLFKALGDQFGDDFKDVKDLGIDFASPMYIFARQNGANIEVGAVAKIQDRAQFEKTFESKTGEKLSKAQDYSFVADDGVSAAVNDEVLVFVSSADLGSGKVDKGIIERVMSKKIEGDLSDNKVFAKVDGSNSFASFCADMSIIPESQIPVEAGISQTDIKQIRSMIIDIDASAKDGVCDFMCNATSTDKEMLARIEKSEKSVGFISEKALSSFSASDPFGFATNIDGSALKDILNEFFSKGASLIPGGANADPETQKQISDMVNKASDILSKIKGNVLCAMHSPNDFVFLAEGKNITNDVVGIMQDTGMPPSTLMKTDNGYNMQDQFMFGYQDNYFYVTTNPEATAQPAKAMGSPAPAALTSLMKDRKFVAFGNVEAIMQIINQAGGASDTKAFSEIFNKIKYVTYSYK